MRKKIGRKKIDMMIASNNAKAKMYQIFKGWQSLILSSIGKYKHSNRCFVPFKRRACTTFPLSPCTPSPPSLEPSSNNEKNNEKNNDNNNNENNNNEKNNNEKNNNEKNNNEKNNNEDAMEPGSATPLLIHHSDTINTDHILIPCPATPELIDCECDNIDANNNNIKDKDVDTMTQQPQKPSAVGEVETKIKDRQVSNPPPLILTSSPHLTH